MATSDGRTETATTRVRLAAHEETSDIGVLNKKDITSTEDTVNDKVALDVNVQSSSAPLSQFKDVELNALEVTFNAVTTSQKSADIDAAGYRFFTLGGSMAFANTPTSISITVEEKFASGTYRAREDSYIAQWVYTRAMITANPEICCRFEIASSNFRIGILASGTTASNTITLTNMEGRLST
jgi:hypothetical protein